MRPLHQDPRAKVYVAEAAGASQSEIFAKKAAMENSPRLAHFFAAAAASQKVAARRMLMLLRGKIGQDMAEVLRQAEESLMAKQELYPQAAQAAVEQGNPNAATAIEQGGQVATRLLERLRRIADLAHDGEGEGSENYLVCQICGYMIWDDPPERCPVCGAIREKFQLP